MRRLLALCSIALLSACAAPPDKLTLTPAKYEQLQGWQQDRQDEALQAFLRTCDKVQSAKLFSSEPVAQLGITREDWRKVCLKAKAENPQGREAARDFFEAHFTPFLAANHHKTEGLFTGYYEPVLHGARKQGGRYQYPLYALPPNLTPGALDRRAIDEGALEGQGLEIVWVDDPVASFFLHIQGSGKVRLAEGGLIKVGYAGKNGREYIPIGRLLIERGELTKENVSLHTIRNWLHSHPQEMWALMWENPSYVFFRELPADKEPIGAAGIELTPGRSLAVDARFTPYGAPVFLSTEAVQTAIEAPRPFHQLLVAQDTGGAIKGPVRGDIYFGFDDAAEKKAGEQKFRGRMYLLLPRIDYE